MATTSPRTSRSTSQASGTGVWRRRSGAFAAFVADVRTSHGARLGEFDELTGASARHRGDALQRLRDRRRDVLEGRARQPSRERDGELCDAVRFPSQEGFVTMTDVEIDI